MITDAETLRKIQVEWGLTGSFKDKPIAEWLAKQNPSQLEYQRAVDNFTGENLIIMHINLSLKFNSRFSVLCGLLHSDIYIGNL